MASNRQIKLYGKPATEDEIISEVVRLLLGDAERKIDPMSVSDVMRQLGCNRQTVYNYREKAIAKGLVELDGNRLKLPVQQQDQSEFKRYTDNNDFTKDPLVADWIQDLLNRRQGKPRKQWQSMVWALESICNTCKIKPRQLVISAQATEKYIKNFSDLYRQGQLDSRRSARKTKKGNADPQLAVHTRKMSVRDFCGFHGISWRRGVTGIMSGKVIGHGKYADVRFTKEELEMADKFIKEKWGLDSDIFRFFWVGVESCARLWALLNMPLEWVEHKSANGKTTFIMSVIETKTEHIKGGKWIKYIRNPEVQESLRKLKAQGGKTHVFPQEYQRKFIALTYTQLKEIYKHVGKTSNYFYEKSVHALRHIGAQKLLDEKDFNYGLVAQVGGWNVIDELKNSYGEMPPEKVLELLEKENKQTVEVVAH